MSSPARRHSPAVYRRRRLVVVLVLLLLIGGGVALALWQPWNALAGPAPTTPPTTAASTPTPSETPTPDASPSETEDAAEPDPEPTETIGACSTSDITVMAVTDKETYAAGEEPKLSISLSNDSETPCLINVGTATQEFVITSGSDTWWRSTDCQTESSDQVVQLDPGTTVTSVEPVVWDRTRSSVSTCEGERPRAGAGTYNLSVSIGGITAADSRRFLLG